MSQKISEAQRVAAHSQFETEMQKGYLEAVLTNLSSGVFAFDDSKRLQMSNSAATEILGIDQKAIIGKDKLSQMADDNGLKVNIQFNSIVFCPLENS